MHLLERQDQLEALNRSFQEARRASGKLVLIAGEAGLGKSALVERFVSEHRREACTFWGACDALATPRALAPVYEIAAQTAILTGRTPREEGSRDLLFRCLLEDLARPERSCVAVLEDARRRIARHRRSQTPARARCKGRAPRAARYHTGKSTGPDFQGN